jgi:hypothetical protein
MKKMLLAALAAPPLWPVSATVTATTITIRFEQFFLAWHFVASSNGYPCVSDVQSLGNWNEPPAPQYRGFRPVSCCACSLTVGSPALPAG